MKKIDSKIDGVFYLAYQMFQGKSTAFENRL